MRRNLNYRIAYIMLALFSFARQFQTNSRPMDGKRKHLRALRYRFWYGSFPSSFSKMLVCVCLCCCCCSIGWLETHTTCYSFYYPTRAAVGALFLVCVNQIVCFFFGANKMCCVWQCLFSYTFPTPFF